MPDDDDVPGILLELNSVASASGIEFISIAPQSAAVRSGYTALPINLSFEGNYYDLTDFLFRLRNLVSVRDGELEADGRLYSLDTLSMAEGPGGFPEIAASLTVTAFYYSTAPPAATAAPAAPATTDTTATTTTPRGRPLGAGAVAMASAKRRAEAMLRAKEAKQKKLLIVLVPIFLGLAVWQGPKMYGTLFGGSTPPEATPVTTTAPTGTVPAPGARAPGRPGVLADTNVAARGEPGEAHLLQPLHRPRPVPLAQPPGADSDFGPSPTTRRRRRRPAAASGDQDEELTAVLEINGVSETVSVGEEFPASDPTFTLVALTLEGATIGVVQGMFEDGVGDDRDRGRRRGHPHRRARHDAVRRQARRRHELGIQRWETAADTTERCLSCGFHLHAPETRAASAWSSSWRR